MKASRALPECMTRESAAFVLLKRLVVLVFEGRFQICPRSLKLETQWKLTLLQHCIVSGIADEHKQCQSVHLLRFFTAYMTKWCSRMPGLE
jgi:hypothetical protein